MSKIKTINNISELLFAFRRIVKKWDIRSIGVLASLPSRKVGEVRMKWQYARLSFQILPKLYPSRGILAEKHDLNQHFILVCPHIPSELAADYRKAGINHADLNGRLFVRASGFLLDREPREKRYINPISEPDLFAIKTSRIIRSLLSCRSRTWTQNDLMKYTQLSSGLISRILKTLVNNAYLLKLSNSSKTASASYGLKDFDALLDAWKAADQWNKRVTVHQYSLLTDDISEIAKTVRDTLGNMDVAFTQWFAAHLRYPYTTPPLVSAYVTLPDIETFAARKVDSGGNLWLIVPNDEGVFYETQDVDGFNLVSDVQIYLDLLQVGQRGPDQAEELRKWERFAR